MPNKPSMIVKANEQDKTNSKNIVLISSESLWITYRLKPMRNHASDQNKRFLRHDSQADDVSESDDDDPFG